MNIKKKKKKYVKIFWHTVCLDIKMQEFKFNVNMIYIQTVSKLLELKVVGFYYFVRFFYYMLYAKVDSNTKLFELAVIVCKNFHFTTIVHLVQKLHAFKETLVFSFFINGWQLAKMKKSIPDMSLP